MKTHARISGVVSSGLLLAAGPAFAQHARLAGERDAARDPAPHPNHVLAAEGSAVEAVSSAPEPCGVVFGYLPYWANPSAIDYSRLTHLACFSVEVDAAGNISNPHGWPWTNTISTARANGVRVHLTVKNFSPTEIRSLMLSTAARQNLVTQLVPLIDPWADGVNIDFEGSGSNGWPSFMPGFLAELRSGLEAALPRRTNPIEVSVATPAVNWGDAWPLGSVAQVSDHVFVMAYDFYGTWSSTAGPTAPLTGGSINVTNTVDLEYAAVLAAEPEKLVLGLPLYGNTWTTNTSAVGAAALDYVGTPTFASALSFYNANGVSFDPASQTTYRSYLVNGRTWRQIWADDAGSLERKVELARSRGLGGIGLWALGYESTGSPASALWAMVDRSYVEPCLPCVADLDQTFPNAPRLTAEDVQLFLGLLGSADGSADLAAPAGVLDAMDVAAFLEALAAGCPTLP